MRILLFLQFRAIPLTAMEPARESSQVWRRLQPRNNYLLLPRYRAGRRVCSLAARFKYFMSIFVDEDINMGEHALEGSPTASQPDDGDKTVTETATCQAARNSVPCRIADWIMCCIRLPFGDGAQRKHFAIGRGPWAMASAAHHPRGVTLRTCLSWDVRATCASFSPLLHVVLDSGREPQESRLETHKVAVDSCNSSTEALGASP